MAKAIKKKKSAKKSAKKAAPRKKFAKKRPPPRRAKKARRRDDQPADDDTDSASDSNGSTLPMPAPGTATVRMYRQGLGDCFLIIFPTQNDKPFTILIDCGVWDSDAKTVGKMKDVVKSVCDSTGGHINVLVATHQHWDHVSGFLQCADLFNKMKFDEVWLAWTEDPEDKLARSIKRKQDKKKASLQAAMTHLQRINPAFALQMEGLLGASLPAAAGGVKADPAKAMEWITGLEDRGSRVQYFLPGASMQVKGADRVNAYVLGPPHDEAELRRNLPTAKQKKEGDAYGMALAESLLVDSYFAAINSRVTDPQKLSADERIEIEGSIPFDDSWRISPQQAKQNGSFFAKHYGFTKKSDEEWRRIDDDWVQSAAQLALWLDSSTNNTSLVLAFELVDSGKVLLFVADAQTGNWLSWADLEFEDPRQDGRKVAVEDLLEAAVLYKVGHHGSHNGSLRKAGVLSMTHDELVAMIPVNRASVDKKHWKMPYPAIYSDLIKNTQCCVMRADEGMCARPAGKNGHKWDSVEGRIVEHDLFIQYTTAEAKPPN